MPRAVGLAVLVSLAATSVAAQEGGAPQPPSAPQAPGGGGAVVVGPDTSGLYFEWALTAIGIGVAVYTVCRSSRRN